MGRETASLETRPNHLAQANVPTRIIAVAFTSAVFVSAALLFVVEPMFGKMVLPLLGGSPAVWTTCMLFFQGALLVGYLYAHVAPRWIGVRRHTVLHILLLAMCLWVLPITIASTRPEFRVDHPTLWLLWVLALSLGAPFVLLSSTGPLLQSWFSRSTHQDAQDPYFLYAASNAGSLLALLSYPFLIEPMITLKAQATLWSGGYLALLLMVAVSAACLRPERAQGQDISVVQERTSIIGRHTALRWIALAFVPSSFFLALTTHLTTDVAAVPLLWVIPLVLYLLSFTIVFGRRTLVSHGVLIRFQPLGLITLAVIDFWGPSASTPWLLPFHLIVFFITALVCHGELARTRPAASRLTDFYLYIALGGVMGGVFNALIAPALFDSVLEYPITLLLACAIRPRSSDAFSSRGWLTDALLLASGCGILIASRLVIGDRPVVAAVLIASAIAAMICLRMSRDPLRFTLSIAGVLVAGFVIRETGSGSLLRDRNFFGVREVREDARRHWHVLTHGTTKHGAQSTDPIKRREPLSYYSRLGPLGDVFRALPPVPGRRVAVIGLGTGAMAAYGAPAEKWVFYEIDPDIARVARNKHYFTYLQDTPARVQVILGDGRISLERAPDHFYDVIVLDAFSSDAIPTHLLTLEALSMYRSKLAENGTLIFHLSNRYLSLEPVVARLISATGMSGLIRENTGRAKKLVEAGGDPSIWAVVVSASPLLGTLAQDKEWRPLRSREDVALWTDDYSNIFSVFRIPKQAQPNPPHGP